MIKYSVDKSGVVKPTNKNPFVERPPLQKKSSRSEMGENNGKIRCPVCNILIQDDWLKTHIKRNHKNNNTGMKLLMEVYDRIHNPRHKKRKKHKNKIINCPICNVQILSSKKQEHIDIVHQSINHSKTNTQKDLLSAKNLLTGKKERDKIDGIIKIRCRICDMVVHKKMMGAHIEQYHKVPPITKKLKNVKTVKTDQNFSEINNINGISSKSKYDRHYDQRDGGKNLGYHQRDFDGKYGSMPIYDDYNEESGPE